MKPKASARQWQLHGSGIETAIPQSQPRGDDTGQVPRPWGAWGVCRHAETAAMPQPVAAGPAKSVKIAAFPNSYLTIFMTEAHSAPPLPDHLSVDPRSPHHVAAVFEHDIACPFAPTDLSEYVEGLGCLPDRHEIINMRVHHGKTWACHSDITKPCVGAIRHLQEHGLPYKVIDLVLVTEEDHWQQYIHEKTPHE